MVADRVNPVNPVNPSSDGKWYGVVCLNRDSQD